MQGTPNAPRRDAPGAAAAATRLIGGAAAHANDRVRVGLGGVGEEPAAAEARGVRGLARGGVEEREGDGEKVAERGGDLEGEAARPAVPLQ
jgi:hypothetical protein